MFELIAERKIRQALERGDFDNLSLKGQPLPREGEDHIPHELRMGYKILKNAGMVPEEVQLRKDLLHLEDLLSCCERDEEARDLRKQISLKRLHFDMLMEKNACNAGFRRYALRLQSHLGL